MRSQCLLRIQVGSWIRCMCRAVMLIFVWIDVAQSIGLSMALDRRLINRLRARRDECSTRGHQHSVHCLARGVTGTHKDATGFNTLFMSQVLASIQCALFRNLGAFFGGTVRDDV